MNDQLIIIIDDHLLFAEGVRSLLLTCGYTNIRILTNGITLPALLDEHTPALLLMDISMEGMDGIELSGIAKGKRPATKILIISMHTKRIYIEKALQAGVDGYIIKNASDDELKTAITTLLNGERYFSPEIGNILLKSMMPSSASAEAVLTPREKDVLHLLAEGYNTKEISEKLFISINTIETHRKNMLFKTGLRNVAHLIKWAFENGQL
jgi:DNA-binding NarL/FixJ family response regulator